MNLASFLPFIGIHLSSQSKNHFFSLTHLVGLYLTEFKLLVKQESEARKHKFKGHIMMPSESKLNIFLRTNKYLFTT